MQLSIPKEKVLKVEKAVEKILKIRLKLKTTLADMYDPLTMPKELFLAHKELDKEVERVYGKKFNSDLERVKFLIELYKTYLKDK